MLYLEIIEFIIYVSIIVVISKYLLVRTLRNLAENLNLKPQTVGDVAGIATSMPELLTVIASSYNGLVSASLYNIVSSNVINLVQYLSSIFMNKNQKSFQNKAIQTELVLVLLTILIPAGIIKFSVSTNISLVPIFIILYVFFIYINNNAHKLYLKDIDEKIGIEIEKEKKWEKNNKKKTVKYVAYLVIIGILLFIVGNLLGNTLENLCVIFKVPQWSIGIILGFATSIPELITFFESQKHHKKNENSDNIVGVVEATNNLFTSNILNLFVIQSIGIAIFSIFY